MLNKLVQTLRGTLSLLWNFHAFSYYFLLSFRFRIFLLNSVIFLEDLLQYSQQIGRAHVRTPVTVHHLVCRLLLEKKKKMIQKKKYNKIRIKTKKTLKKIKNI